MALAPTFRTDVTIRAPASQNLLQGQSQQRIQLSSEFLDSAAENVNKQIDNDIRQMLDSFEALMSLSRIRDKDVFRIAQENFELEGRADAMVRSAQSLTLLSHSLKLSLLFSQEPIEGADGNSLDEEALSLIKSTAISKKKCAEMLEEMFKLGGSGARNAHNEARDANAKSEKKDHDGKEEILPLTGETIEKLLMDNKLEMKEGA